MNWTRGLAWVTGGILALTLAAFAVIVLAESRRPATLPANSPEAAIHGYVDAWEQGDFRGAHAYFSMRVQRKMRLSEYLNALQAYGHEPGESVVYVDEVAGTGVQRTLHLTVERYEGVGLDASRDRWTITVPMVHEVDGWKIDQPMIGLVARSTRG